MHVLVEIKVNVYEYFKELRIFILSITSSVSEIWFKWGNSQKELITCVESLTEVFLWMIQTKSSNSSNIHEYPE